MAKRITGNAQIDSILRATAKQFKKENMASLGPSIRIDHSKIIPTGSVYLDCLTGVGGFPNAGIIEIYGPPSAGKTSLSLQVLKQYLEKEDETRRAVFIDLERTTSVELIKSMGINPDEIIFIYPDTAEEALQYAENLGKSGQIGMIIFDSVDAAQTQSDVQRNMGENGVGNLAKLMAKAMRSISKVASDLEVCYIFLNQIHYKIGVMFGNPETTSGGEALRFYATLRVDVRSKLSTETGAILMKIKIEKNKVAPKRSDKAELLFYQGKGVDPYADLIEYGKDIGIFRFAGSAVKINLPEEEEYTLCTGGKNGARSHLAENPSLFARIKDICYRLSGIGPTTEEATD